MTSTDRHCGTDEYTSRRVARIDAYTSCRVAATAFRHSKTGKLIPISQRRSLTVQLGKFRRNYILRKINIFHNNAHALGSCEYAPLSYSIDTHHGAVSSIKTHHQIYESFDLRPLCATNDVHPLTFGLDMTKRYLRVWLSTSFVCTFL